MRTVTEWLDEYSVSHRHPVNKIVHWVCVPAIVLSVMGLLWSIPTPKLFSSLAPGLNWATLVAAAALIYYLMLSPALALGVTLAFVVMLLTVQQLSMLAWPLWVTSLVIFAVAWVGQFIGHSIEGTRPSFFKDVQFLLIGPLWLIARLYRKLKIDY